MKEITGKDPYMKIVGIIAEYNPFHRGHLYHLQQAKKTTGADGILVILSGNYAFALSGRLSQ